MTTIAEAVRRLRIVQTYETRGAEQATRHSKEFAAAQREVASTTVTAEKASLGFSNAQRLVAEAHLRARAAVAAGGQYAGSSLEVSAKQTATALRSAAPVIGAVAQEASIAAGIFGRALAPSLAVVGKEAMITATVVGRELRPALSTIGSQVMPIAAGVAGYVAAAAAIGYLARSASESIAAWRKLEDQSITLTNVIAATGGAAGKSTADLLRLADAVGNIGESRQAVQSLLTFRSVAGETFDGAMKAANDLAASGFGSVTSAAKAMGQALEDPRQGLSALEQAGLRFGAVQKVTWQDMVETGRRAEAQRQILQRVAEQVGGAGAMRSASLSGAWTELSDAMQRGNEQWGQSLATALRLADAVGAVARAVEWLNSVNKVAPEFTIDIYAQRQFQLEAMRRQGRQPTTMETWLGPKNEPPPVWQLGDAQDVYARVGPIRERYAAQRDGIDSVIDALERERRALQHTNLEREIERRQREAQARSTIPLPKDELDRIAVGVTENELLKKAIEERARAEEEAAARQKRDEEFMRRTAEQRQTAIEKLLQERDALFMSAEAARAAAIAQAELAKYRERGIPVTSNLTEQIKQNAEQRAAIEAMTEKLRDAKSMTFDFASSFTRDMRRGASATEAFASSLDRLTDRLLDGTLKSAIDGLFGSLGQGGGGWLAKLLGLAGSSGGGSGGTGLSLTGTGGLYANGAAFYGGRLIPFAAGGVVDRPTIFPMANGMGLMGEAGAEAIMPLRRAPDGRLGVEARGGAGAAPVVNVSVQNNASGADVSVGQARRNTDGSISVDMIIDQASARMAQQVNAGRGPLAKIVQRGPVRRG